MLAASAAAQENHWPVAIVGPFVRTVAGAGVTLAGEGADPDGDAVTYRWRQGDGPAVLALAGADTWTVTFTPAVAGVYTLVLTVFDGRGGSGWATERVVVRKAGVPRVTYVARARPGGGPAPDDRGEIWRASEDGSGATRLFASLVGDRRPAWSPDGLKAVFHSNITTTKGDLQQVDENGQNRVNLTSILSIDTEDAPCWEPDGSGLYFQTDLEDYATVHRMEPEGAKIYNVLRSKTAQDLHPSLSPCGKRMVTARQMAGGMSNLYVLDAAAAVETRLTSGPWRDAEPDWSPVGPRIVWESNRPGPPTSATTQVWIGDSDGSGQTCLTSGSVNRWPAWTADGTRIAFVSDRDGQCELYSMLPDGSDVRRLSSSTDVDEAHPCVEPAGAPANRAPVIFAGPTRVFAVNRPATLAASAYEPDGEAMTTSWQQVSGPATVVLTAPASLQATLTPSALGWYGFRFTAMDSRGAATASTVAVEVRPAAGPNTAPRVTLPFPGWMNGVVGQTLTLSPNVADPEGSPLTCSWRQVTPYPVALLGVTSSEARFTPTTNGLYDFELTARDPEGLTKSATQRVVVRADASVELTALVSGVVTNIGLDGVVKSVMDTSPLTDARPCDWTPDGSRLMLNATWEGRASLFEKTAGSGLAPQRRVTNCQSYTAEHERGATYSPDGKDFIYDAELPASHSYYPGRYPNLNSSGGWLTNEKSVSSHAGEWRFDGRRWFTFQCVEATNGTFQIRSSFWEKMASGNRSYGAGMRGGFGPRCFFASDQNRVLFASRDPTEPNGIRAIWRTKTLGLSAYNCERLTSGHFDTDAHALPDGSRIVFLSDRAYPGTTAVLEVFSAKPDGTDIQRVTYLNAPMSDLILRPAGPRPQRYPSVAIPPIPTALAPAPVTLAATAAALDRDALTYRWT
ncbi:MAG: PD40 domain-containing protein, partial [Candidatus Riflebacteria bacterium]|nr:PD40 domain-containing protein [Candidatus Riflebacteria bacterium]